MGCELANRPWSDREHGDVGRPGLVQARGVRRLAICISAKSSCMRAPPTRTATPAAAGDRVVAVGEILPDHRPMLAMMNRVHHPRP